MSNTHLHAPVLQLYQISAIEADLISEHGGFFYSVLQTRNKFTILGSRFSTSWGWNTVMRASVLTALLLSFCPTISVTSSGLSSKWLMSDWHSPRMVFGMNTNYLNPCGPPVQGKMAQAGKIYATSDEAECWGLALIPHLLRIVLASRWKSRTSEKRNALLPRTHTVKALLLESGFSTLTTWKNVAMPERQCLKLLLISMQDAIWDGDFLAVF